MKRRGIAQELRNMQFEELLIASEAQTLSTAADKSPREALLTTEQHIRVRTERARARVKRRQVDGIIIHCSADSFDCP